MGMSSKFGIVVFFVVIACINLADTQITILPPRDIPPPELSVSNTSYGTPLNATNMGSDDGCAVVHSIERTSDGANYRILIDLNINGRGCKKVLPWTVAPNENGMIVYGKDALTKCNTNSPYQSCKAVNSGPSGGISLSFDPPVYSFPLTVPQNNPIVPFGYAGYYAYETTSQGACANYGYANKKTQLVTTINGISHAGIAFAFPGNDQCDRLPTQNSFISTFSGKQASERVFAFNSFLSLPNGTLINTTGLTQMNMPPYGYANASSLLGIIDPFVCKRNNTYHNTGNTPNNIHACPMTANEWEAILPDVVINGQTVDVFYGPNTTSYGEYQRDGPWIVPLLNTNTLPVNCFVCSFMRDARGSLAASGASYASGHMPINTAFGPICTALRASQSHINAVVSVGGYVGISKTDNPFSGVWITSAGFPVRNMKQIGNTEKLSDVVGQGSSSDYHMIAEFSTTGGTNGNALNVDMDALRYVMCNGLSGSVIPAGYNSTIDTFLGPLVSTLRSHSDQSPVWPNPFRYTSPVVGNVNCVGCTYPSIRSQKGWTIFDSMIWEASQGKECGKYQSDHSVWTRILSMVNSTEVDITNVRFFSKWNDTSNRPDLYLENAPGLNLNQDTTLFPKLMNAFIPGIGPAAWASLIGNLDKHACRPSPYPYFFESNNGQQAIPLCSLFQRQLYYQTYALNETLRDALGIPVSTPDLNSASQTGIYNMLAPNIWFGVFQKSILDGNSQWLMFMDDTFDKTGNSIFEEDGIAKNVTGRIEMIIPTSLVDIPYTKRSNAIQNVVYRVEQSSCLLFNQFATPSMSNYASISTVVAFGIPHGFVNTLVVVFTPVFDGENSQTRFNYQVDQMVVQIKYPSGAAVNITNYDTVVIGNQLYVKVPYMTVSLVYEYYIVIPAVIGAVTNNALPIIDISSYFENTVTTTPQVIQNITLENTNTIMAVGCDVSAIVTPLPISLYEYPCVMAGENPSLATCYGTFLYKESGSTTLVSQCSSSKFCPPSESFFIESCGFAVDAGSQSLTSGTSFHYDGSSINYNLNGAVSRLSIASSYTIDNCGIDSLFFHESFGIQVCGSVSNAATLMSQSIPCDGAFMPFERIYDIINGTAVIYRSVITWQSTYKTTVTVTFIGPIVTIDILQNDMWFVQNINDDVCSIIGTSSVFCNYDPLNTIFDLSLVLHMPFNCSEYDVNLFYSEDIQIVSKTIADIKLMDDQSVFNYFIDNYRPTTYICSNNDIVLHPITTTTATTTHTISTVPSDQTNTEPFNFQQAYDNGIKSIKPLCVIDFSNIVAEPGLLPLNSYCYPFVNSQSYFITPNCSIVNNDQIVPDQKLRNSQIYRNVFGVYSNFTELLVWKCQLFLSELNATELLNCTVYGDTGKRVGDGCYYFEDKLAYCSKWWNLSCGINNYYQFTFLFLLIISIPVFILIIVAIYAAITFDVENEEASKIYGKAYMKWVTNLEKKLYGIGIKE